MMLPRLRRKPRKEPRLRKPGQRLKSTKHRAWVRKHECSVGNGPGVLACEGPIHAHHVKTRGAGGGDEWAVSLCAWHHDRFHANGRETFRQTYGVDLEQMAQEFASRSPDKAIREAARAMQSATPVSVRDARAAPATDPDSVGGGR